MNHSQLHLRCTPATAIVALYALLSAPMPALAAEGPSLPEKASGRSASDLVDAKIIAQKTGWSLADTQAHLAAQDVLGSLIAELANDHPDTYAGAELAKQPGGNSHIYFKGPVPADARERAAAAGIAIELAGGSKRSLDGSQKRSVEIVRRLAAAGFDEVGTALLAKGLVDVTVRRTPAALTEEQQIAAVLAVLPAELRDDVRVTVADVPVARNESVRGGYQVTSPSSQCTSGFTVFSLLTGTTGVTTAAHCSGINQYGSATTLTYQAQHESIFGDVEWHTSSDVEPAEYYAAPSDLREVNSVESWFSIAGNSWYCVYSRMTADRDCDEVYSTFVNAFTFSGGLVSSLVGMTNDNTIGGDSGGPWSYSTEAVGTHRGDQWIWFKYRNVFSVADLFVPALGVLVQTQ